MQPDESREVNTCMAAVSLWWYVCHIINLSSTTKMRFFHSKKNHELFHLFCNDLRHFKRVNFTHIILFTYVLKIANVDVEAHILFPPAVN